VAVEPNAGAGLAPTGSDTRRAFFALWPDAKVRHVLWREGEKLHRELGGRLTREESVHMTLLFLGDVPRRQLERLIVLAESVPFKPFTLFVDTAACWKHNKVAWVGSSVTPPELGQLVNALESVVAAEGLRFDRRPFAPHMTLVRKARCGPLDFKMPRIEWRVTDYVLVQSELNREGSLYTVIGRWPRAA
jgi:RNA 2',3'-cyclic 3'-phosphodiesterase